MTHNRRPRRLKAVFILRREDFPYIHDLDKLLALLEQAGETIPDPVREAKFLSQFAIITRYPGFAEPVTEDEHQNAVRIAETVILWAQQRIGYSSEPDAG